MKKMKKRLKYASIPARILTQSLKRRHINFCKQNTAILIVVREN